MTLTVELERRAPATDSVLIVLPPPRRDDDIRADTRVGGLPLLRRIVLAGARAGFTRVLVGASDARADELLAGSIGEPVDTAAPLSTLTACRAVVVSANVVPQPAWLRALRELVLEPDRLHVEPGVVAVADVSDGAPVVALASRCHDHAEAISALRTILPCTERALEPAGRFALTTTRDVPAAERWLLRSLIKPSEGFMSRHVERRISLAITRRLVDTRVTPNAMTVSSVALGLVGAPFFLSSRPSLQLAGALIFLAHSILDGCDGELARLKLAESRAGAALDFWGDNLVHGAVFTCLAVGWSQAVDAAWPLILGGVTVVAALSTAVVLYARAVSPPPRAAGSFALSRAVDALAHRDFIYVIVALAAVGKAAWFLVIAAVGTPLFLVVVLWSARAERRP